MRLAPLGFALASYRAGSDAVRVGPEVYATPGEAEEPVRSYVDLGPLPEGVRFWVVALTPVSEIPAQEAHA